MTMRRVTGIVVLILIFSMLLGAVFSVAHSAPRKRPSTAHYLEPWPCMQPYKAYEAGCMYELYQLGLWYLNEKKYDQAIMRFSQILSMKEFGLVYANRGAAYAFKNDYAHARPDMARALDLDPKRAENWFNLARVDYELKRYRDALDSANVAVDLDPSKADFLDMRAMIHKAMRHEKLAATDTARALEIRESEEKKIISERQLKSEQ